MFLFKRYAAVITFGSLDITVMVAKLGRNGEMTIVAKAAEPYRGYSDGHFEDERESLETAVKNAVENAQAAAGFKLKSLYIGVPTDFTLLVNNSSEIRFGGWRKLKENDLRNLRDMAEPCGEERNDFVLIDSTRKGLYSDGRKIRKTDDVEVLEVKAEYSFLFADKYFCDTVGSVLKSIGLTVNRFFSEDKACVQFVLSQRKRVACSVLCDCGSLLTSVAVCDGPGFSAIYSVDDGGEYLTKALIEGLGIDYAAASDIKKKINLNLVCGEDDTYKSGEVSVSAREANALAIDWINGLADKIFDIFVPFIDGFSEETELCIVGGGLAHILGAAECMSNALNGMPVRISSESVSRLCAPEDASGYALIKAAHDDMFN